MNKQILDQLITAINTVIKSKSSELSKKDIETLVTIRESLKSNTNKKMRSRAAWKIITVFSQSRGDKFLNRNSKKILQRPLIMNIGFALKSIRKQLGVSQLELSVKTGVSQASLSQFENGVKNPSTKTINKICEALDIPPSIVYIIGIDNADVPASKKFMFDSLYPSIRSLALDIILPDNQKKEILYE